jgi:hypothetical protein
VRRPGGWAALAAQAGKQPAAGRRCKALANKEISFAFSYLTWYNDCNMKPSIFTESELLPSCRPLACWVDELVRLRPELASAFREAGIVDEPAYLANEKMLKPDIRHTVAIDRFILRVGVRPSSQGIIDNLHCCPPWLLGEQVEGFLLAMENRLVSQSLAKRIRNVCQEQSVETIQNMADIGLFEMPKIGRKSIRALGDLLFNYLIDATPLKRLPTWPWEVLTPGMLIGDTEPKDLFFVERLRLVAAPILPPLDTGAEQAFSAKADGLSLGSSLQLCLNDAAQNLTQLERGILACRLGIGSEIMPLAEIARELSVTRERVRQLESKIHAKLSCQPYVPALEAKIKEHLGNAASPVTTADLVDVDPWFAGYENLGRILGQIFKHQMDGRYFVIRIKGLDPVVCSICQSKWDLALGEAKKVLRKMSTQSHSTDFVRSEIGRLLPQEARELRQELWSQASEFAIFTAGFSGDQLVSGHSKSAESLVHFILKSAAAPLHYKEIKRQVEVLTKKTTSTTHVHNAASAVGHLYSRGTYGLKAHCALHPYALEFVAQATEKIITEGPPSKQWHAAELVAQLKAKGADYDGQVTKYVLAIALNGKESLAYLGRMVWMQRTGDGSQANQDIARKDIRGAIVEILQSNGSPMHLKDIKKKLTEIRGLHDNFQIFNNETFISFGHGVWGLVERDLPRAEADANFALIQAHLERAQKGIHISEMSAAVPHLDEKNATILYWYCKSKGMRTDSSQTLYLAHWKDSRRMGVPAALDQVIQEFGDQGLTLSEIHERVSQKIMRPVSKNTLSHLLANASKLSYNQESRLWFNRPLTTA